MKLSQDIKAILLVTFGVFGILLSIVYVGSRISCHYRWKGTYISEYGLFSGCRVQKDGKWFPERTIRNFD